MFLSLCSVDHLRSGCSPRTDSHSNGGKAAAAHHSQVSMRMLLEVCLINEASDVKTNICRFMFILEKDERTCSCSKENTPDLLLHKNNLIDTNKFYIGPKPSLWCMTLFLLSVFTLLFLFFPSQVTEHPNSQRLRQLQPEHGFLWALDHPVPTLHNFPLQEEAKESPRWPQPPGGQLAPLLRSTFNQMLPPPTTTLHKGRQMPGPQTMKLYEALR